MMAATPCNTKSRFGSVLLAIGIGLGAGAIVGMAATEIFFEQERQRVESTGRYRYHGPGRTALDTGSGGGVGGLAGTVVGGFLLWFTNGRMWVVPLLVGIGVAATVGYVVGFALPMPGVGLSGREPFASGGGVGGGLAAGIALGFLIRATWAAGSVRRTEGPADLADHARS